MAAGRPEGAASDLMRALVVADLRNRSGEEVIHWLHDLATALNVARGGRGRGSGDAAMAIDRACTRIDVDGDARARRDALIDAGRCFGAVSLFDRAKEAFDHAEKLAAKDDKALRRVLMARVEVARRSGEFGEAAEILSRLEPLVAAEKANPAELYEVLVGLGSATSAVGGDGARDRAIGYLDRAEAITARIGDNPARKVDRLKSRMLAYFFAGDFQHAADTCERIIEITREAGLVFESGIAFHNLGDAKIRLGEHAAAYAALQQSLALAEEGGHERLAAINRAPIAYLDGIAGDPQGQLRLAEIATWNHGRGYQWDELNARYWLGLLHVAKRNRLAAVEELNLARGLAQKLTMKSMVADCDDALEAARKLPNDG
jgi:eukaryotic-like serine/threonine-protein kinase